MFEKIWARHVVAEGPGGHVLLYVDRHLLHEGTTAAFGRLARSGRTVRRPDLSFATADHYLLTSPGSPTSDAETRGMVEALGRHTAEQRILYFGVGDPRRGIVHVIGPEQGLTVPGITLVCGDSHTATHGAFGALAFGIGSSEVEHVLATQTLWQKKPLTMRISVEGRLAPGVSAKDVVLAIIAKIGAGGGVRHAIEYAGSTIRDMSMDERMTVCNMSIEAGARAGMIAPDETTYAYMGLTPGTRLIDVPIDRVFIGSCTNGRIEDLRAAAEIARGRKVAPNVSAMVVPGSGLVKAEAEKEGLDKIFLEAGFEWRIQGCSMCLAMNADRLEPGQRCASTSNRNFEGRQGRGGRTHLVSPAMAAAAAIRGTLADVRDFQ